MPARDVVGAGESRERERERLTDEMRARDRALRPSLFLCLRQSTNAGLRARALFALMGRLLQEVDERERARERMREGSEWGARLRSETVLRGIWCCCARRARQWKDEGGPPGLC